MIEDDAAWALVAIRSRRPLYALRRNYYDGLHRLAFATDKFRNAFARTFSAFADNLCAVVVDTVADRLEIDGWGAGEDEAVEAAAIWRDRRLKRTAGEIHQEALALADSYLIVWRDQEGRSVWWPNVAEETAVRYDPERPGVVELGAKVWQAPDGRARLTLYYPDRIERYATPTRTVNGIPSEPRSYVPYGDDVNPPVVLNPYGIVPVFHFANSAGIGRLGRSQIDSAIPLQDALNKSVLDGLVGSEALALPQRWGTGVETRLDPRTGEPMREPPMMPGEVLTVSSPDARFGEFAAANLSQLIEMSESYRLEIARVTGTPAHRLLLQGGDWPSGEALRVAEAPLVATCIDRADAWGPTWGAAMALAERLEASMSDTAPEPVWRDPSSRSEVDEVAVAEAKRRLGVSTRQVLRELRYTEEQIDAMMAENEEAAARAMARGAL